MRHALRAVETGSCPLSHMYVSITYLLPTACLCLKEIYLFIFLVCTRPQFLQKQTNKQTNKQKTTNQTTEINTVLHLSNVRSNLWVLSLSYLQKDFQNNYKYLYLSIYLITLYCLSIVLSASVFQGYTVKLHLK